MLLRNNGGGGFGVKEKQNIFPPVPPLILPTLPHNGLPHPPGYSVKNRDKIAKLWHDTRKNASKHNCRDILEILVGQAQSEFTHVLI